MLFRSQDALRARGLSVDTEGFNAAMERQRAEARRAWSGSGEAATETIWYALRERVGATEFLGYETETAEGVIRAIVKYGVEVETLNAGERGSLILKMPLQKTSVDFLATAGMGDFAKLRPFFERVLLSVRPRS